MKIQSSTLTLTPIKQLTRKQTTHQISSRFTRLGYSIKFVNMDSSAESAVFTNFNVAPVEDTLSLKNKPSEGILSRNYISSISQGSYVLNGDQDVQPCEKDFVSADIFKKPKKRRIGRRLRLAKENSDTEDYRTESQFRPTYKYKAKWFSMPEVKDWIVVLPNRSNYVGCKLCKVELRAHLHDLKKHAKSIKHRKAIVLYQGSIPENHGLPFAESIALETLDCHDGLLCVESNISINHDGEINIDSTTHRNDCDKNDNLVPVRIGFIGAGNIAQALICGFISSGIADARNIIASAPSEKNLIKLQSLGIKTTYDNNFVVQKCDVVFLALRPLIVAEALANIEPVTNSRSPLFVSIVTGLTILRLEGMLTSHSITKPRVVRLVPNTSCMVLQGACVYSLGTHTTSSEGTLMKTLLGSLGMCAEKLENEIEAATGLCASAPAFIYAAIDALSAGAVKMGFSRDDAVKFAAQVVKGSATMVSETGRHPCQLRDEVCCPSGSAIAGIHVLEKFGFRNSLMSALEMAGLRHIDSER